MRLLAALLLISAFAALPAHATEYKAGTVGYLYESCKAALKDSKSVEEFDNTYCGGFIEGYVVGVASNSIVLPPPAPNDPCKAEKEVEFARINNRFCANLPGYQTMSLSDIQSIAPTGADIFFRWIAFIKKESGKKDALNLPVTTQLNAMIGQGNFCEHLGDKTAKEELSMEINPALTNINLMTYIDLERRKTLRQKYLQCGADIEASNKKNPFRTTRCGAEITGFITGLLSTRSLLENRPKASPACEKQMSRLYNDLDVSETMCVTKDTNPLDVGKVFIQRAATMSGEKNFDAQLGYGAAGYQPIYYGFLCKK